MDVSRCSYNNIQVNPTKSKPTGQIVFRQVDGACSECQFERLKKFYNHSERGFLGLGEALAKEHAR
jgi:hypothetical protein